MSAHHGAIFCRCGGIGRRPGLKIPCYESNVPVRDRSPAPHQNSIYRGVEQLVARRAHNPEVVRFKSHPRNQKENHPSGWFFFLVGVRLEPLKDNRSRSDRREWVSAAGKPRCGFPRSGGAQAGGFRGKLSLPMKTTRDASGQLRIPLSLLHKSTNWNISPPTFWLLKHIKSHLSRQWEAVDREDFSMKVDDFLWAQFCIKEKSGR